MIVEPYLSFEGRCDEALTFYKSALDAKELMVMRFKDNPDTNKEGCPGGPVDLQKVMHSALKIGDSNVMMTDGRCTGKMNFSGIHLSLTVDTEAQADKYFNALNAGGKVLVPLNKTFFSKKFGMVQDKFGVDWMVLVKPQM